MPSEDPHDEHPPDGPHDTLRRLERRLDEASAAAERLIGEAAKAAAARTASPGRSAASPPPSGSSPPPASPPPPASSPPSVDAEPPPAGWQVPPGDQASEGSGSGAGNPDVELLTHVIQSLRELVPTELERRLTEALREVLLALRALIDWYLERHEQQRAQPVEVQDIPIV